MRTSSDFFWQVGHTIADEHELAEVASKFLHAYPREEQYPYIHERHAQQRLDGFGTGKPGALSSCSTCCSTDSRGCVRPKPVKRNGNAYEASPAAVASAGATGGHRAEATG